tara:strand:+ start:12464 stop:13522 length:1059 start_codon:yes stop_codon:yes gene_type:complete
MKIAVTGKPFVGKTTIFRALTRAAEDHHLVDKPNIGTVKVPDRRIDYLSGFFQPKKTTYAELIFTDFAGFEKTSTSLEKQPETLNQLKTADALAVVCKLFEQDADFSPVKDIEEWVSELLLADLQTIENRLERINKSSKGKKLLLHEEEKKLLLTCKDTIESGTPLRNLELTGTEKKLLSGFQMLSIKPVIVIYNISDTWLGKLESELPQISKLQACPNMAVTSICGEIELEIAQLDESDRIEFMKEMGIEEPGLNKFIRASYGLLGLISFFTVGKDEVKAWTVKKDTDALNAAGEIHSDIERGFIRAEIISYEDFKNCGSMSEGKKKGLVRLEGKKYVVQDGDIINFRFNV